MENQLFQATTNGDLPSIKRIIQQTSDDKVNFVYDNGEVLLHIASKKNYPEIVQYLLKLGANPNHQDQFGRTALHYAALNGFSEICEFLISFKAVLDPKDQKKMTPLHLACANNHANVVEVFARNGSDLFVQNCKGHTPIDLASISGSIDSINVLISYHDHVNPKKKNVNTPLHFAVQHRQLASAEVLINHGANVNAVNQDGNTPLIDVIQLEPSDDFVLDAVHLLIEHDARLDIMNKEGFNALYYAIMSQNESLISLLVNSNCKLDCIYNNLQTPVHEAVINRMPQILRLLISNGANPEIPDKYGNVPMHYACDNNDKESVLILLEAGCDPNFQNKKGKKAKANASYEIITLIAKYVLREDYQEIRRNKEQQALNEKIQRYEEKRQMSKTSKNHSLLSQSETRRKSMNHAQREKFNRMIENGGTLHNPMNKTTFNRKTTSEPSKHEARVIYAQKRLENQRNTRKQQDEDWNKQVDFMVKSGLMKPVKKNTIQNKQSAPRNEARPWGGSKEAEDFKRQTTICLHEMRNEFQSELTELNKMIEDIYQSVINNEQ